MKTPYAIAKELNVSPQAVYKKLTPSFLSQQGENIETVVYDTKSGKKSKYRLNATAEQVLKQTFGAVVQSVDELVDEKLLNQLNSEITFLRSQVENLTAALRHEQMSHSETRKMLTLPAATAPMDAPMTLIEAFKMWRRTKRGG